MVKISHLRFAPFWSEQLFNLVLSYPLYMSVCIALLLPFFAFDSSHSEVKYLSEFVFCLLKKVYIQSAEMGGRLDLMASSYWVKRTLEMFNEKNDRVICLELKCHGNWYIIQVTGVLLLALKYQEILDVGNNFLFCDYSLLLIIWLDIMPYVVLYIS